jgi:membrane protease YdiL (CAAX protease family)
MAYMTYNSATTILPAAGAASGRPWSVWATIAWCVVALGPPLIVARAFAGNPYLGQHLPVFLAWAWMLITPIVAVMVRRAAVAQYLAWDVPRLGGVIAAVTATLVGWSGFWYLSSGGASIGLATNLYRQYLGAGVSPVGYLLAWYPATIYAPIVEETVFRGFLWRGLAASRLGNWGAWLLTSALFVAVHIDGHRNLADLISVSVGGLILGLVRWRTGSTTACMIAHSATHIWMRGGAIVAVALGWP